MMFRRLLPVLGFMLVIEAGVAAAAWSAWRGQVYAFPKTPVAVAVLQAAYVALPGLLGVCSLLAASRDGVRRRLPLLAFVTVGAVDGIPYLCNLESWSQGNHTYIAGVISSLLGGLAAPALWGTALVRIEDPANLRYQKFGRIAAGLVQLGFVFQFVSRAEEWARTGLKPDFSGSAAVDATRAVGTLLDLAGDLLLLWASVESLRSIPDVQTVRQRARRIHRLMKIWIILFPMTSMVFNLNSHLQEPNVLMFWYEVWRATLYPLITLIAAFSILNRLPELQIAAPEPPMDRSGGVQ